MRVKKFTGMPFEILKLIVESISFSKTKIFNINIFLTHFRFLKNFEPLLLRLKYLTFTGIFKDDIQGHPVNQFNGKNQPLPIDTRDVNGELLSVWHG